MAKNLYRSVFFFANSKQCNYIFLISLVISTIKIRKFGFLQFITKSSRLRGKLSLGTQIYCCFQKWYYHEMLAVLFMLHRHPVFLSLTTKINQPAAVSVTLDTKENDARGVSHALLLHSLKGNIENVCTKKSN